MGLFDDLDDIHEAGIEKIDKVIDKEARGLRTGCSTNSSVMTTSRWKILLRPL